MIEVFVLALALCLTSDSVQAATLSQLCESAKLKAAGTYSQCLGKADSTFARSARTAADTSRRDASHAKCDDGLLKGYASAELRYGAECATPGDVGEAKTYLTQCSGDMTSSVERGGFVPSYLADIEACNGRYVGRLLKTGQTTSYGWRTDGNLQKGTKHSFTDNGDGTVSDNRTGLVWEKKSWDGSIHDVGAFYTWVGDASWWAPSGMDGTMVTIFLATLNTPPCFADHCDWRIPNRKELESISNLEGPVPAFPAFNTNCEPGCALTNCSCTSANPNWTSSDSVFPEPGADRLLYAWAVALDGVLYFEVKNPAVLNALPCSGWAKPGCLPVRAVRAGL